LRSALATLMEEHGLDALLHPTSMVLPETLDNPKGGWAPELAACSGWPALSVPAGASKGGQSIGVELLGLAGTEGMLLSLAALIEQGLGVRKPSGLNKNRSR
jgi:Asp-tRNA(Asn)/Glu-tRNA(Gln) amidotransferase A subunit family amidase